MSSKTPFTEQVPVAPVPTESVIDSIGGLITSYFSPLFTELNPNSYNNRHSTSLFMKSVPAQAYPTDLKV